MFSSTSSMLCAYMLTRQMYTENLGNGDRYVGSRLIVKPIYAKKYCSWHTVHGATVNNAWWYVVTDTQL